MTDYYDDISEYVPDEKWKIIYVKIVHKNDYT